MSFDLSSSNHLVKFYQFEITKTPYTKTTSDGKTQKKFLESPKGCPMRFPTKMPIQNFYQ